MLYAFCCCCCYLFVLWFCFGLVWFWLTFPQYIWIYWAFTYFTYVKYLFTILVVVVILKSIFTLLLNYISFNDHSQTTVKSFIAPGPLVSSCVHSWNITLFQFSFVCIFFLGPLIAHSVLNSYLLLPRIFIYRLKLGR